LDELEVPKHDDVKGRKFLYDQITAPGYERNSISEERNKENTHWSNAD
jgi:hypothetical protein